MNKWSATWLPHLPRLAPAVALLLDFSIDRVDYCPNCSFPVLTTASKSFIRLIQMQVFCPNIHLSGGLLQ